MTSSAFASQRPPNKESQIFSDEQALISVDVTGSGSFDLSSYVTYARPRTESHGRGHCYSRDGSSRGTK